VQLSQEAAGSRDVTSYRRPGHRVLEAEARPRSAARGPARGRAGRSASASDGSITVASGSPGTPSPSTRGTGRGHRLAAHVPVERENATRPGKCFDKPNAKKRRSSLWGPVNVRLERMGGVFDQRSLEPVARCADLNGTVGKTVGVTCQDGGNGRPRAYGASGARQPAVSCRQPSQEPESCAGRDG
jgi:hypothetical protein